MVNELHPGSLHAWIVALVKCLLGARTAFGYYLSSSIRCCRFGKFAKSTALFPIPVPFDRAWLSRPKSGSDRRYRRALERAVHLCVVALNYMYLESPFACLDGLRRCPNASHVQIYKRLGALIRAGGPTGMFSTLGCGRKSFQLDARLGELSGTLQRLGLEAHGGYAKADEVGGKVPIFNDKDELVPYRSLDASRLVLSGTGAWDCTEYLSDLLYLPFVEPKINTFQVRVPDRFVPDFSAVTEESILQLCKVWDDNGLLKLFPYELGPMQKVGSTKVFNNFKSPTSDRQIGDRRSRNFQEGKIAGVSSGLPAGRELLQLAPKIYSEKLVGCIADRKDFYHQFAVTDERAMTNGLYPFIEASKLCHLKAYEKLVADFGKKTKLSREQHGDNLHFGPKPALISPASLVQASFGALYQGDHLGVEIATEAHSRLLQTYGLLRQGSTFLANSPLGLCKAADGLVIDDFFSISCEAVENDDPESFESVVRFKCAKKAYAHEKLFGSDAKDVFAATKFKVIGAEINSNPDTVLRGVITVGAPFEKRLGLGLCSAQSAMLPMTSDSLHASLVGSWISTLAFRKQVMAVLNEAFAVIPPKDLDTENPRLWKLGRGAATELQLLACLAPVLCSNVAAPFLEQAYATDASEAMGGIAVAHVGAELSEILWKTADRKGANVPMLSRLQAVVSQHDNFFEDEADRCFVWKETGEEDVTRPIGLRFQFIEVCGGAGRVTKALIDMNVVCGPVLDLSISRHYNLAEHRVIAWVAFMLEEDRLESFLVAPPCTTFSPAAYPSLRSYRVPEGYDAHHPRVWIGNLLAYAALTLLFIALRLQKLGLGEQPRRSKMRWLKQWKRLLSLGAKEAVVASCRFGSPHQKEFCFCGVHMAMHKLAAPCTRDHPHVPIQGKFTKPSATYVPGLAVHLAEFIDLHLRARHEARLRFELNVDGLEDVLSNDVCSAFSWEHYDAWTWTGGSHINVLEAKATLKVFREIAKKGGDVRFCYFGDSHVARSVIARGRSSSHALRPTLFKIAALCVAFGLYPAGRFVPTRLNPADAPSRGGSIDPPSLCPLLKR